MVRVGVDQVTTANACNPGENMLSFKPIILMKYYIKRLIREDLLGKAEKVIKLSKLRYDFKGIRMTLGLLSTSLKCYLLNYC